MDSQWHLVVVGESSVCVCVERTSGIRQRCAVTITTSCITYVSVSYFGFRRQKYMLRRSFRFLAAAPVETGAADGAAGDAAAPGKKRGWFKPHIQTRRNGSYRIHEQWGRGQEGPYANQPLQMESVLHCADNSNCKHVRLIRETSERKAHTLFPSCVVHRVSLVRFKDGQTQPAHLKLQPGEVMWCALLARRQTVARHSGLVTKFDKNAAVLINDKGVPLGTRITYAAGRHLNHKFHLKAAVLANFFI